jgi:hypothetical protein
LSSQIDSVIAWTDLPNTASLAVMRRLGMRFHKNVQYPLGAGVEYVLHRDDAAPLPAPILISAGVGGASVFDSMREITKTGHLSPGTTGPKLNRYTGIWS